MRKPRIRPLEDMNTEELRDAHDEALEYMCEAQVGTSAFRFWQRRSETAASMLGDLGARQYEDYLDSYADGEALASAGFGTDEDYGGGMESI